jgi:hypothetical protein
MCIWNLEQGETWQLLPRPADEGFWSPDGSELLISVLDELWLAKLDPNMPTTQSMGPALTLDEVLSEEMEKWTLYIEADPDSPEPYLERALICIARHDYEQAHADLEGFTRYVTAQDNHLFYMICWWGWRYCSCDLFEGGELLMTSAAGLLPRFPNVPLDAKGQFHPVKNLVSIYERRSRTDLAENWRAMLPADTSRGPEEREDGEKGERR